KRMSRCLTRVSLLLLSRRRPFKSSSKPKNLSTNVKLRVPLPIRWHVRLYRPGRLHEASRGLAEHLAAFAFGHLAALGGIRGGLAFARSYGVGIDFAAFFKRYGSKIDEYRRVSRLVVVVAFLHPRSVHLRAVAMA